MYHKTGRPPGRPRSLPQNLEELVLGDLLNRMNTETRLVLPDLRGIARRLGISHASIRRVARVLHDKGKVQSVAIPRSHESRATLVMYRI